MPEPRKFALPRPPVMSYDEWMKRTRVSGKLRGYKLKDLDAALAFYEKAQTDEAMVKVAEALLAWMDQSHPNGDYLNSKRNDNQAIGALLPVINWFFSDPRRREMIEALGHLKSLYREQEKTWYLGKRLEFKTQFNSTEGALAAALVNHIIEFLAALGTKLGICRAEAKKLIEDAEFKRRFKNAFNTIFLSCKCYSETTGASRRQGAIDFFLDIIPGVKLALSGVSLVDAIQAKRKADAGRVLFESQSPEALFQGLSEFFYREIQYRVMKTASAGVDLLKIVVPGMQIVSIVQYATRLAYAIGEFVRDYREMNAANAILDTQQPFDTRIFFEAPILAAYHVCSLDTAGTALFLFNEKDRWLSYDFVEKVEKYNKGILGPVKSKARELINSSSLVLTPGGIPLVTLASNPNKLAEQHGWFWWKYQNAKRWCSGKSHFAGNAIEGPSKDADKKEAA